MAEIRKMIKIGNSLGITIPADIIEQQNLVCGDSIKIEIDNDGKIILTPMKQVKLPQNIRADVLEAAYDVMKKYKDTLKGLQNR